ncbi:MAG TPA: flagellar FliJ family protein [Nitrospiraceae bacterium]|jgi:flagellar export protein FliJ
MKLDVLRRYRAQLEEVVRRDLFLLRQELQDIEARFRLHDAHMERTTEAYLAQAGKGVALDEFLVWQSKLTAETSKLAAAKQLECQLREVWSRKQDELREAMHDRRKLDRLADRMRQRHQLALRKIDQMEMDEAARRTGVV